MKFLIITHVLHKSLDDKIYGYGPYIKEMNLWLKHVDEVRIVGPIDRNLEVSKIDLAYAHDNIIFDEVPLFSLVSRKEKLLTLLKLPFMFFVILKAMFWAEHIHLRCPGNMGLLGSIAQVLFPSKCKTAKYAGNWDPNAEGQAWSYKLQKKILANTSWSKKMKILVYGEWPHQTKNVLPFFTATYKKEEIIPIQPRELTGTIKLLFVGSFNPGKRIILALEVVKELVENKVDIHLDVMGDGKMRVEIETYIKNNNLKNYVTLHGNQNADYVKSYYQKSHFLILMSKSEGWPKVVAEAMFWGCVPISTNVSCVNYMMGYGSRGKIAQVDAKDISEKISYYKEHSDEYKDASLEGVKWSQEYILETFEDAIEKVLKEC